MSVASCAAFCWEHASLRGSACVTIVQDPRTVPVQAVDSAGTNKLNRVLAEPLASAWLHSSSTMGTNNDRRSEDMLYRRKIDTESDLYSAVQREIRAGSF